jgi:hypothetical protein
MVRVRVRGGILTNRIFPRYGNTPVGLVRVGFGRRVSMKPTIEILISSPLSGSEAAALRDLLIGVGAPALILANFEIASAAAAHEIDFVVITEVRAELIELKNITAPLRGGVNGPWQIETSPGLVVPYVGPNPWEQARDAKLALSDAMHEYARTRTGIPGPAKRRYYEQFDASVTVYPTLVPGSKVGIGNYKAWVRSFLDTVQALNSRPLPLQTTWTINDWRRFAVDYLRLIPASLSEAIDPAVFRANQAVMDYAAKLQHSTTAALLPAAEQEMVGANVIEKLRGPGDVVLLGRSGLGKSFHLEHYRRLCFGFDEVPALLHGRHYQRDLQRAIFKSIAPYTPLSPVELLDAAKKLGRPPVLLVDGWNDCPAQLQGDLGNDLGAFRLRYNARVVIASQTMPQQQWLSGVVAVDMAPLREEHKRAIFAFHAGMATGARPAHCYEQFSTAFDLTVAGRCQTGGAAATTRAELYDSYARSVIPSISARAVIRKLAWYMGENLKPVLTAGDFERLVEKFLQEMKLPLSIADELLRSRILEVDRQAVTFEHELLRQYFRAEEFLRKVESKQISTALEKPKYIGLAEFVIPSLSDESLIRGLLSKAGTDLLNDALHGKLGATAERVVRNECESLLKQSRDELAEIDVEPFVGERAGGGRFVSGAWIAGSTCASDRDRSLCAVIANNLNDDSLRAAFLELLELGEWALLEACERAGQKEGMKPRAIFREVLHHNIVLSHCSSVHPLLFLCHEVRQSLSLGLRRHDGASPLGEALLEKIREGTSGTIDLLLLMAALRYREANCPADVLAVARQAWDTGFPQVQMEALDFIHSNARAISNAGAEAEAAVIELLETFDVKNNIFLSTQWLDTRSSFSGFEIGINATDAAEEFRVILRAAEAGDDPLYAVERESNPNMTFAEFAGTWASSALGKVFEYVFQGIYYEAYDSLADDERKKLLTLALRDPRPGSFDDWYLEELSKFGFSGAEDILARYGGRIDPESFCPQDTVSGFILANKAWAQISHQPLLYRDISTPDHQVWSLIGELIFRLNRPEQDSSDAIGDLCRKLSRYPAALPDALRQLEHSNWKHTQSPSALQLLIECRQETVRDALHASIRSAGSFTSVFRGGTMRSPELFRWTIAKLGDIGDRSTISLLRPWTESKEYGTDTIRAIEKIENRVALRI